MVDPVTGWFKLAQLRDKLNAFVAVKRFDFQWLARYPRPREIGFDNGGEFMAEFRDLCDNMGLKRHPSSSWNPQSNAILERIHQVLADCLRPFNLDVNAQLMKWMMTLLKSFYLQQLSQYDVAIIKHMDTLQGKWY